MSNSPHSGGSEGPSTDRYNDPVIDPTKNVLQLVEAAMKRVDDLSTAMVRRQDDLREAASRHSSEMAALRAEYQAELRQAETERINAIRAVDVAAVQQASSVQETRATALAAQVAASAEAMRNQVQAAATAAATSLAAALEPVQKDIADLRRAQYEAQGVKAQTTDARAGVSNATAIIGAVVAIITISLVLFLGPRSKTTTPEVVVPPTVTVTTPAP
jgi:cobalamin biosynthesis Mg chelatase CobN